MEVRIADQGLDNYGLGRLVKAQNDEETPYQPFEVSRHRLGIISYKGLKVDENLLLKSNFGSVSLIVSEVGDVDLGFGLTRYKLSCLDQNFNIEEVFKKLERAQIMSTTPLTKVVQNVRFQISPPITIKAKTFGTRDVHKLSTENVSRSGFLMISEMSAKVPFINNTLLEIEVENDGHWLDKKLSCVAKVIRCVDSPVSGEPSRKFGIKILEMSGDDAKIWSSALTQIEDDVAVHNTYKPQLRS